MLLLNTIISSLSDNFIVVKLSLYLNSELQRQVDSAIHFVFVNDYIHMVIFLYLYDSKTR